MKNRVIILTAALLFAMSLSAHAQNTLTITGLDAYNGLFIAGESQDEIFYAAADIVDVQEPMSTASIGLGGIIENGSVTLPVWETSIDLNSIEEKGVYDVIKERYTGSGPLDFYVRIWERTEVFYPGYTVAGGHLSVTFNNGKAETVLVVTYTPDDDD
jgi:cytochrome c-type biogenesis protein CcmE